MSSQWDDVAHVFIDQRSNIGARTVRTWAESLTDNSSVIDIGCGSGKPITQVLLDCNLNVFAIDSSPQMVAAFSGNFPDVPVACETLESSAFFGRKFDAALAWGLLFLLRPDVQRIGIQRIAHALNEGGRFLFTSPLQICTWDDISTGITSQSLGAEAYKLVLRDAGMSVVNEFEDEGGNHYYDAIKQRRQHNQHYSNGVSHYSSQPSRSRMMRSP